MNVLDKQQRSLILDMSELVWMHNRSNIVDLCGKVNKLLLCVHKVVGLYQRHDVCFTSAFFPQRSLEDHNLSYAVYAPSDVRQLADLLKETKYRWENPKYNEVILFL